MHNTNISITFAKSNNLNRYKMDNNTKYGVFRNKVSAKKLAMGEIKGRMVTVAKGIQIEAKPGKSDEETITAYKLKHNIS